MADRLVTVAVDIGSLSTKAMVSGKGHARRVTFPTRISLGERAHSSGSELPCYVVIGDDIARVGDRSEYRGFVTGELAGALSPQEKLGALLSAAFSKLGEPQCDVLMVNVSEPTLTPFADSVRYALETARPRASNVISAGRIGVMGSATALAADVLLDMRGEPDDKSVPPDGFLACVDCGAREWRYARLNLSKGYPLPEASVAADFYVERAAISAIEEQFEEPVVGVSETMGSRTTLVSGIERDVTGLIDAARHKAWREFGASFVQKALGEECKRIYAGGGHATALSTGMISKKHIDTRVAKQCEMSIVRGLLKSGNRWGRVVD
ncbi:MULTISPECIES: hypothetical protein [Hyphomicrobiales]|mgnify:CR=1 FL=1|uniref:hypothetical protein n=1 Tax=Hyphomicrobiales TaxID=356 RepID=UPI000F679C84|nr:MULTISPECIES: hypothetical protein [Hyphomicrobiales]MCQ9147368.1 hypothetical protein [Ochrobactrum sp. BTU2]MDH1270314.1 hypothetical protein [Agrobacterium pusense]MDX4076635.1 hypothetical protein [Brucella sp. NBRC 113783]RSC24741.1 hypothetical protein EGT36_28340 [Agrobacterium sp. FDAARGOS_525]